MIGNNVIGNVHDTCLTEIGKIRINGIRTFEVYPEKVETVRKDIFKPGHFSVFAVLAMLGERDDINLEYHFDKAMNTYVIDSINDEEGWWYYGCYDRGRGQEMLFQRCRENNMFRMDHFPYKDKMAVILYPMSQTDLEARYKAFRAGVARKTDNNNKIIIPNVRIRCQKEELTFRDVEVKPHNLRNDIFMDHIITALDSILSLGAEQKLSYELTWTDKLNETEIKNYYLTRINDDKAYGRCGFVYDVYEVGVAQELRRRGGRGIHIHVHPGIRVINSPNYVDFRWICLG